MYTTHNFRTKAEFKRAISEGASVRIYQPGPFGTGELTTAGRHCVEGPHYPAAHTWYATVTLGPTGLVIKVV